MNGFFGGSDFPKRPTGLASTESQVRAEVGVGWIVSSGVGLLRGGLSSLLLVGWVLTRWFYRSKGRLLFWIRAAGFFTKAPAHPP